MRGGGGGWVDAGFGGDGLAWFWIGFGFGRALGGRSRFLSAQLGCHGGFVRRGCDLSEFRCRFLTLFELDGIHGDDRF